MRIFLTILCTLLVLSPVVAQLSDQEAIIVYAASEQEADRLSDFVAQIRDEWGMDKGSVPVVMVAGLEHPDHRRLGFDSTSLPCLAVVRISKNGNPSRVLGDPPALVRNAEQSARDASIILSRWVLLKDLHVPKAWILWGYELERQGNTSEAISLYHRAAKAGHPTGMSFLASRYRFGDGVPRDYEKAVYWYRKSVDAGSTSALYSLGMMYLRGHGVTRNPETAIKMFHEAADKGDKSARTQLARCYFEGDGVFKDRQQAVFHARQAAEQGEPGGQVIMGQCFALGEGGLRTSFDEAVRYFKLAADQGDSEGMFFLGYSYENGLGVIKDVEKAVQLYRQAARGGGAMDRARQRLKELGRK